MKVLEMERMEEIKGSEGGFWTSFACVGYVVATIGLVAGTGGAAAPALSYIALAVAGACGTLIGLN
ncbi:MAG: hypothetical protein JKY08_11135 [Flavobacteriaceae bacterium]|nr:hypothetical protein [Flavobacteriaceae bacterium]